MRKHLLVKKIIAFVLCLSVVLTGAISARAIDISDSNEERGADYAVNAADDSNQFYATWKTRTNTRKMYFLVVDEKGNAINGLVTNPYTDNLSNGTTITFANESNFTFSNEKDSEKVKYNYTYKYVKGQVYSNNKYVDALGIYVNRSGENWTTQYIDTNNSKKTFTKGSGTDEYFTYLIYSKNSKITYSNEGMEAVLVKAGESTLLPTAKTVEEGYEFLGWSTNDKAEAADPGMTVDATYTPSGNVILYPVFKAIVKDSEEETETEETETEEETEIEEDTEEDTPVPSGQVKTVNSISKGVTINLFDYKVNTSSSNREDIGSLGSYNQGNGINKNHYLKFMNSAWQGSPSQNKYDPTGITSGLLNSKLGSDGYPQLANWGNGESLAYLFDGNDISNAKKAYLNRNHLFQVDSEGYYYYNSDNNFATIADSNNNNFIVYDRSGSGFYPFTNQSHMYDDKNSAYGGDTLGSTYINHYFGMTVATDFLQPASGKVNDKDMVYEFSGDDDVFVFIDDVLILDIGGIHGTCSGKINFATGEVYRDKVSNGTWAEESKTTIKELFEAAGVSTEDFAGNTFADFTNHTMKMYYLERGSSASNCSIKFNLQTLPKGSLAVAKSTVGLEAGDDSDYTFVLKDSQNKPVANASYKINGEGTNRKTNSKGEFTIKANQYALFSGLDAGDYYVTETEVTGGDLTIDNFNTYIGKELSKDRTASVKVENAKSASVKFVNFYSDINGQITKNKYIKYNADGDFDLTLDIKGFMGQVTGQAKVDVIFVMDTSNSMKATMTSDTQQDNYKTNKNSRFNIQNDAVKSCIDSMAENVALDASFSVVSFDSYAGVIQNWTDKTNVTVPTKVANYSSYNRSAGGTNYEAAMDSANTLLSSARTDAKKVIVFLSDGDPTFRNNGGNGSDYSSANLKAAYNKINNMSMDYFYSVGVGPQSSYTHLEELNTKITKTGVIKQFFTASSQTALNKALSDVEASITKLYCTNVVVSDTLSEYAELKSNSFTIRITKDGKEVASGVNTVTVDGNELKAVYDSATRTVKLLFPANYALDPSYVYSVTMNIKPTAKAYEEYAINAADDTKNNYPSTGDKKTDAVGNTTSSGKAGFESNLKAEVAYTYNGQENVEKYLKPVIQVVASKLVITKVDLDDENTKLAGAVFTLVNTNKSENDLDYSKDFTTKEDGTIDLGIIPEGSYKLVEKTAPNGYRLITGDITFKVVEGKITDIKSNNMESSHGAMSFVGEPAVSVVDNNITKLYTYNVLATDEVDITYIWNIYKVSSSDKAIKLAGAEFTLTGTNAKYYGKSEPSTGLLKWYSDEEFTIPATVAEGSYVLKEIQAPTGYTISDKTWMLDINDKNQISIRNEGKELEGSVTVSEDERFVTTEFYFEDEALYSLPQAGGIGIYSYIFGGMLMLMAGALFIYRRRMSTIINK